MAYHRAIYLAKLSCSLSALMVECLLGNRAHFDPRLFSAKPHPGQITAAKLISSNLFDTELINDRIQDTYALRCAPAIIGVLFDALEWVSEWTETEINSASDNPLLDTDSGDTLHGGNFYGGHIAFAMDSLKNAVANIADLVDRQVALRGQAGGLSFAARLQQPQIRSQLSSQPAHPGVAGRRPEKSP